MKNLQINVNVPQDEVIAKLNELAKAVAKNAAKLAMDENQPVTRERLMLKIEALARADRRRSKRK